MSIIKDIEEKMYEHDRREEAKKIPRKDLEDIYVHTKYSLERRINPIFMSITIALTIIILILGGITFAFSENYENSEETNYRAIGNDICEKEELGNLRTIHITKETIEIRCYNRNYEIPIKWTSQ